MLAPSSSEDEDDSQGYASHDRGDTSSLASACAAGFPGQSGDSRSLQLPAISSAASIRSLLTPASEPSRGANNNAQARPMRYVIVP